MSILTIHLIKVPLLLVKVGSQTISSLHINHEVLHLTLQPLLGLLQRGAFGVHSFNGFLSILETLGKLFPAGKKKLIIFNYEKITFVDKILNKKIIYL